MRHKNDKNVNVETENDIVEFDAEFDVVSEEDAEGGCKKKLADMRASLKECRKEREDNLAGWQRAKADIVNMRRMAEEDIAAGSARGKADLLRALLPGLDSFEHARTTDAWHALPEEWQSGMERVFAQLEKGFSEQDVERFGAVDEAFDPQMHECMSMLPCTEKEKDNTIAQVLQQGYRIQTTIVRPAKVVVFAYNA